MKFTFAPESRPLEGYTIKRAIYRGGFGEVYYALTDAGREVALKLLQNNTEVELRGVQQCLNLSHPNLVTIFDIRQDGDGDHWILMEFVAGETLDVSLRRHPQGMPMEEIRRWVPGLAAGVTFLHDRGIVHRDLKPANVFIENNVVKVGDVGLSKFIAPSKRSAHTQSVGTVYYMAPEVAKGKYGKEVDVYAIGIMLYEMLSGHVPFDGESTGEILMKHLSEAPNLSILPPRLQPVIARALEKDPARRFPTVAALAESFERAVLGKPLVLDIPEASFVAATVNGASPHAASHRMETAESSRHSGRGQRTILGMNLWVFGGLLGLLFSMMSAHRR
ncbi:MAG: serine/threonine-protein kinase [Planctomycetaceae bacterium]